MPPFVMASLIVLFHWGLVAGVGVIPFDATTDFYPWAWLAVERARDGSFFDLWTPWLVGGNAQLHLSLLQYDPFYWVAAAVPGEFTEHRFDVVVVLHLVSGGVATYLMARSLSIPPLAAALAGLVFALGGRATSLLQHTASAPELMSWFAWSVLLVRLAVISRPSFLFTVAAALAATFALSRSPSDIPNYMLGVVALGAALPVVSQGALLPRAVAYSGLWTALSLGLLAGSISVNAVIGLGATTDVFRIWQGDLNSVPAVNVITAFIPGAVGNTDINNFVGSGDPTETWLYWGLFTLLLAAYETVRSRSLQTIWLGLVGLAGLGLALGMATPLYSAVFLVAPPVQYVHRAAPYLALFALAIALLAAAGAARLAADLRQDLNLRKWLASGLALAAALSLIAALAITSSTRAGLQRLIAEDLAVAGALGLFLAAAIATFGSAWRSRKMMMLVLLGLVFFDLWHAGAFRYFSFASGSGAATTDALDHDYETVAILRQLTSDSAAYEYRIEPVAAGAGWENGLAVAGFQTLGGSISLQSERLALVLGDRTRRVASGRPDFSGVVKSYSSRTFDLFNVRYIVSPIDLATVDDEFAEGDFKLVHDGFRKVYENEDAFSRVRLTGAIAAADRDEALELLRNETVNLETVTIVEGIPSDIADPTPSERVSVSIKSYDPSRIRFEVTTPEEAVLVLADNYFPGWKASVDGEKTSVLPANVTHRAVLVPAGSHTIEMWFSNDTMNAAFLLSKVTLLVALTLAISLALAELWKRARQPPPKS